MSLDLSLPLMTRGGSRALLVAVLPPERMTKYGETIVALVTDHDGDRTIELFQPNGHYFSPETPVLGGRTSFMDLVNAPVSVIARQIREVAHS